MALKALISKEDHAKLGDALKGEYQPQADGTYLLSVEGVNGFALENVTGLKNTLATERENARKAGELVSKFGDLDPEKARDALGKVEKMSKWTPEEKVADQLKAQVAQVEGKYTAELKSKAEREAKLHGIVTKLLVDSEVRRVIADKGSATLLLPHMRDRIRVEERNGEFVPVVVDEKGTPRISMKSGSSDPMGIEEYVLSTKNDKDLSHGWFGSGHSGSGAAGSSSSGAGGGGRFSISEADARADPRAYQKVRAEAEKAGQQVEVIPTT